MLNYIFYIQESIYLYIVDTVSCRCWGFTGLTVKTQFWLQRNSLSDKLGQRLQRYCYKKSIHYSFRSGSTHLSVVVSVSPFFSTDVIRIHNSGFRNEIGTALIASKREMTKKKHRSKYIMLYRSFAFLTLSFYFTFTLCGNGITDNLIYQGIIPIRKRGREVWIIFTSHIEAGSPNFIL